MKLKFYTEEDINLININSSFAEFKLLYNFEYVMYFTKDDFLFSQEFYKYLKSKRSTFIDIFYTYKHLMDDSYINVRKQLYKSMCRINLNNIEEELQLENSKVIFYNHIPSCIPSFSEIIHVYDDKIDIFCKNGSIINISTLTSKYKLDLKNKQVKIFLFGCLLTGASENENEPLWFGELKNGELDRSRPVYYLIGNKNSEKQILKVFIGNNTLLITDYSISDSSLGIKLETKSKKTEQILNQEQEKKQEQEKSSSSSSVVSTAKLCPVLEDDVIMCPHGGQVQLKSNKGKPFKSQGVPLILEPDLINAPISGCSNNVLGVPQPCTMVAVIPPAALSMKKLNSEKAVMQDYVSMIMTDKGVPLQCIPKPNKWKLLTAVPTGSGEEKESEEELSLTSPILSLKISMLSAEKVQVISSSYENRDNAKFNKIVTLSEITKDNPLELDYTKLGEDDEGVPQYIYDKFSPKYSRELYTYKILTVVIHYTIYEYVLLVPKGKSRLLKSLPKEKQPYGLGRFIDLAESYGRIISDSFGNDKHVGSLNITGNVFKTGIGMEKLRLVIGLDMVISDENKDDKQSIDIINVAKIHTNFSYPNTEYYKLHYSIMMYTQPVNRYYQNDKNELKENFHKTNAVYDTLLNIDNQNTSSSSNEESVQESDKPTTEEKEKFACELLNSNNIINKLENNLKSFNDFIDKIGEDTTISDNRFLVNIYREAKGKIDSINQEVTSEVNKLKELDDNLIRNLLYREICNIIKDNLVDLIKLDKLDGLKLFRGGIMFLRRIGMAIPGVGILFIIYEIVSILWSLYEKYKEYSDAREGYQIGKEFYSLYIYFNKLDENLAYIVNSPNIDNTTFIKIKTEYDKYAIHTYTLTNKLTLLSCFEHFCGLNYRDTRFRILFYADSKLFDNSLFALNDIIQDNQNNNKDLNNCVQLSLYNNSTDLYKSSYYNHVKYLILKANIFTMIQTSNYCSLIIDHFIKQSYKIEDEESLKKDKYFVIISNQVARNDLRYRIQSKMNLDQQNSYSNNLVCFNIRNKYKISSFFDYYCTFINNFTNKLIESINNFSLSDCENKGIVCLYNFYTDIFIDEIFDYSPIFFSRNEKETRESIYDFFDIVHSNNSSVQLTKNDKTIESISKICYNFFEKFNKYCEDEIEDEEFTVEDFMLFLQEPAKICDKYGIEDNIQKNRIQPFFENFSELYLFMLDLNTIKSYFYDADINAVDLNKLNYAKDMFKKEIKRFFENIKQDCNPNNIVEILLSSAKTDKVLMNIYSQMVDVLYSQNFANDKNKLIESIMQYIQMNSNINHDVSNNTHFIPLEKQINEYLNVYEDFVREYNEYITCSEYSNFYNFDRELLKEVIYLMIHDEISYIFPINRNNIDYILYNKKYYILLSECIYHTHFLSNENNFSLFTLRLFSTMSKYYNYIPLEKVADLYSIYYLLQMYIQSRIGNKDVFNTCTYELFSKFKEVIRPLKYKIEDKLDKYIHDSIIYCIINDYDIEFSIKEIYDLSGTERDILALIISSVIQSLSLVSLPITEVFSIPNAAKKTLFKSFELIKNGKRLFSEEINNRDNNSNNGQSFTMYLSMKYNAMKKTAASLQNQIKTSAKNGFNDFQKNIEQVIKQDIRQKQRVDFIIEMETNIRHLRRMYGNIQLSLGQIDAKVLFIKATSLSSGADARVINMGQIIDALNEIDKLSDEVQRSNNMTNNAFRNNQRVGDGSLVLYKSPFNSNSYNQSLKSHVYLEAAIAQKSSSEIITRDNSNAYDVLETETTLTRNRSYASVEMHGDIDMDYRIGRESITIHQSSTLYTEANTNNFSIGKELAKGGINLIADIILETYVYDNFFSIIDKEEYESKLYAIKYAYMNQISNIYGTEWNISKDYFTLPMSINQNYIMSDFRAMVVGGAHFDNSCFVKGISAGIFVQNNKAVTNSFVDIIVNYIDIIEENQLDVKMGKYLVAYYKVINFLDSINTFYHNIVPKLKTLLENLSNIQMFIEQNKLIQRIEEADNEKMQSINGNSYENIESSLMKDFVIQLKRIGESNYKFYETQKPGNEEQVSDNSSDERMVMQISSFEDDEIPVLLGSLIYDENWFKSTIDDE